MDPYEQTAAEMKRQSGRNQGYAKTALGIGATVLGSSFIPILARAAPMLSEYIPQEMAIKGLSKINPRFGKFIKDALDGGYDFSEIKDFIGQQIKDSQEAEKKKEDRNIIQQYSPELFQFVQEQIQKGMNPLQAGALAQADKRFSTVISKLTKDHKMPWSNILETVFGGQQQANPQQQQNEAQQPQQPGQGQQALMQILAKINQRLGA